MMLEVSHFDEFFAAVNGGWQPFAWQRRLVSYLADERRWPARISAPTGSGKTAVIEAHVFAVALSAGEREPERRLPRRLSLVVDRRALVDDQYDHARKLALNLRDSGTQNSVVAAVADALRKMRGVAMTDDGRIDGHEPDDDLPAVQAGNPLTVVMLRGGVPPSTSWRDDPLGCMVLCATPDMWGSRLLMRGYGAARHARPREAGLLAYDSVVVVDEAHLARQLVHTSRRIAELEATALQRLPVARLQVVQVTATPVEGDAARSVRVEPQDLASPAEADKVLAQRLGRPKPLSLMETSWPATSARERQELATKIAYLAVAARETCRRTVGCVVNTIALAVEVAGALQRLGRTSGRSYSLEVIVGRKRPFDVGRLRRDRPGLFTTDGDPTLDFVVATQTIEVGIDMDLGALVTELAPGAAIAQRAGRVNRLGARQETEVVVLVPPSDQGPVPDAPPYASDDLVASEAWLRGRAADANGLAPWSVCLDPPPGQVLRRMLLQRPEMWDAWLWARTSDDLLEDLELDLWLSDDLEPDRDISLVVRQALPDNEASAIALLRQTLPRAKEAFPVPLNTAKEVLASKSDEGGERALLVVRGEEVLTVVGPRLLRPGDVVVVDSQTACFRYGVVVSDGDETATDVLEEATGERDDPFVIRIAAGAPALAQCDRQSVDDLLSDLAGVVDAQPRDGRVRRHEIADIIRQFAAANPGADAVRLREAATGLDGPIYRTDVAMAPRASDSVPEWIVVKTMPGRSAGEELRQEWLAANRQVPLDEHSDAVAARAGDIGLRIGLEPAQVTIFELAGRLHDTGKRDRRFQALLRDGQDSQLEDETPRLLAKSGRRTAGEARSARARSSLPAGWRHEQLSAADAWQALDVADPNGRDLIVRLIGTTHGRGRGSFPMTSTHLTGSTDGAAQSAELLYDAGEWDALIERTHAVWGVWGCAYLEALVRAADCQVSGEER
jgi:CRISPR-associated endonuclease/helicase Cas3